MSETRSHTPDEIRRILERRAAALATPPPQQDTGETIDVLVTSIAEERYAIDVSDVVEVRPLEGFTRVPGLPPVWAGLVNLRGTLYSVVDARAYLGLEGEPAADPHVVVISTRAAVVGLMVDDVAGFRSLRVRDIEPPLGADAQAHRKAVSGVTTDLLLLLDVRTLIDDPTLVVDENVS